MRKYWRVVCFMMLLTGFGSARADMGMITPGVDVTIKEHSFIRPIPGFKLYDSEFQNFAAFKFKSRQEDGSTAAKRVNGSYYCYYC